MKDIANRVNKIQNSRHINKDKMYRIMIIVGNLVQQNGEFKSSS